jgi:hypothetical protein
MRALFEDEIVAEVRKHREELLDEFGGTAELHRHFEQERSLLEKQGWVFATPATLYQQRQKIQAHH